MKYNKIILEDNDLPAKYSFTRKTLQYVCGEDYQPSLFFESDELFEISKSSNYLNCVKRLQQAIYQKEKVVVYGDYDVDGICATSICYDMLLNLGLTAGYYLPNRFVDGYGLTKNRVEQFAEKGYTLIVCVDNGVVAHEAIACAHQRGIDVIIIDHHEMDEKSTTYPYLIHPSLLEPCFQGMCGAGLVFELSRSFLSRNEYIMLAALGTIADMMVLIQENRRIVRNGLRLLNDGGFLHLNKLSASRPFTEFTLAMEIAPKLNAMGRLPDLANVNSIVKYFMMKEEQVLNAFALQMEELNNKRKELSKDMTMLAEAMLVLEDDFFIVSSESFHEGLVGLVATQIVNRYQKPTMVLSEKDGICKGSIRSTAGLDLVALFRNCPGLLTFGGHKMAGGISFQKENIELIRAYIKEQMKVSLVTPYLQALSMDLQEITLASINELSSFRPLLSIQKEPLYIVEGIRTPYMEMSNGLHLKWNLSSEVSLLYFNHPFHDMQEDFSRRNFVVKASINEFRGKQSVSLIVQDSYQE